MVEFGLVSVQQISFDHDPHIEREEIYDYEEECREPVAPGQLHDTKTKKRNAHGKLIDPKFYFGRSKEVAFKEIAYSDVTYSRMIESSVIESSDRSPAPEPEDTQTLWNLEKPTEEDEDIWHISEKIDSTGFEAPVHPSTLVMQAITEMDNSDHQFNQTQPIIVP